MKTIKFILLINTLLWSQSAIQIISPEPGEEVAGQSILIAASFYNLENLNINNVQISLDEKNITTSAFVDPDMISYLVPSLDPGNHTIRLTTQSGEPVEWTFNVLGEIKQETIPVEYSGKIRTSTSVDQIDNESLNINQITFDFQGSAYEWMRFKTKIKLTTQENPLYQARNVYEFGLNLGEFIQLNFGDTNPRISQFTMAGKRIRGLEFDLSLGWFQLHFVKGEINRSIKGDKTKAYSYTIDTDDEGNKFLSLSRQGYTFKQDVFAGRLAFGKGEHFQWGIHFLKARDDTLSINKKMVDGLIYYEDPSGIISELDYGQVYTINELGDQFQIDWSGVNPKDNIVLGTDLGISLDQKRIVLEGEMAFSLTNNNIWGGAISKAELDTLIDDKADNKLASFDLERIPIDPIDITDWFIINSNIVPLSPLDPNAFGDSATISIGEAIMSMPSLAYRGRAVINYFGNYFSIEYSQVGPEFLSLANPYLLNDKRELKISDKLRLLDNRLMVNLGYKHQDDDILTTIKNIETQNTFSLGLNILPGPGLPTANLTFRTIERDNGIKEITYLPDSTFTDNQKNTQSNQIMVNLNHRFHFLWSHNLSATVVLMDKKDNVKDRFYQNASYIDPGVVSNVVNISLNTRYNIPLKTIVNISTNSSEISISPGEKGSQTFFTGSLDGEYSYKNDRYILKAGVNYANGYGIVDMSWLGLKTGTRVNILDGLSFNGQGEYRIKNSSGISKNTLIVRANLDYTF